MGLDRSGRALNAALKKAEAAQAGRRTEGDDALDAILSKMGSERVAPSGPRKRKCVGVGESVWLPELESALAG